MTTPARRAPVPAEPTDAEVAASKAALEKLAQNEETNNHAPPAKKKAAKRPTDKVLMMTARLDRILAEMTDEQQHWAFEFLRLKYGRKPASQVAGTDPRD
jgi:hypothetical protein